MSELVARIISGVVAALIIAVISFVAGVQYAGKTCAEESTKRLASLNEKQIEQTEGVDQVITKFVDRWHTIEVPVYVPSANNTCHNLDGAFRVFFDGSTGAVMPEATGSADAPPVPVEDLASTIADNHKGCRQNATAIEAWQEWAKVVSK